MTDRTEPLLHMNFNPRLREGGDTVGFPIIGFDNDFNPRLREGGDLLSFIAEESLLYFNPRLREGGDT